MQREVDFSSYSYDMMVAKLMNRKIPYSDETMPKEIKQLKNEADNKRPNIAKPEKWPPELIYLIERCWDKDPASRPLFTATLDELGNIIARLWRYLVQTMYSSIEAIDTTNLKFECPI